MPARLHRVLSGTIACLPQAHSSDGGVAAISTAPLRSPTRCWHWQICRTAGSADGLDRVEIPKGRLCKKCVDRGRATFDRFLKRGTIENGPATVQFVRSSAAKPHWE